MSGDSREQQWFYQPQSLAVIRWNTVSILVTVQGWSDFSCSQCAVQYYYPPLAFVSMHRYYLVIVCFFCMFHCSPCAVFLCSFINYLVNRTVYDDATQLWYVPHHLKLLRHLWKIIIKFNNSNILYYFIALGSRSCTIDQTFFGYSECMNLWCTKSIISCFQITWRSLTRTKTFFSVFGS